MSKRRGEPDEKEENGQMCSCDVAFPPSRVVHESREGRQRNIITLHVYYIAVASIGAVSLNVAVKHSYSSIRLTDYPIMVQVLTGSYFASLDKFAG